MIGNARPGATVAVEWNDDVREATANADGLWVALFPRHQQPPVLEAPPDGPPARIFEVSRRKKSTSSGGAGRGSFRTRSGCEARKFGSGGGDA